jgi:hypothetical protein
VIGSLYTSALAAGLDNYMMYNGTDGVYTHTVRYERDPTCPICSAGTAVPVTPQMTLQQARPAHARASVRCRRPGSPIMT